MQGSRMHGHLQDRLFAAARYRQKENHKSHTCSTQMLMIGTGTRGQALLVAQTRHGGRGEGSRVQAAALGRCQLEDTPKMGPRILRASCKSFGTAVERQRGRTIPLANESCDWKPATYIATPI